MRADNDGIGLDIDCDYRHADQIMPALSTMNVDAESVLQHIGQAIYRWSIGSDKIEWSANAAAMLHLPRNELIASGRAFALFTQSTGCARHDAVLNAGVPDLGQGVPYQVEYAFQPEGDGGETLWLEDTGRWFAGADKRPAYAEGVVRIITERYEADRQAQFLSRHDQLTGQLNRTALMQALDETLSAVVRGHSHACFLIAAVDNLGVINDAYGFDVADELLVGAAKRIRAAMRGGDALGRFSGNKFGIVVGNCSENEMAIAAARFVDTVSGEPIDVSVGPVPVSLSIGGVSLPRFARTCHSASIAAQDALSAARKKGRGQFAAYSLDPYRESRRRRNVKISDELVRALNDQRIQLALHPVVGAHSGEVAFYECLTRLERCDGTVVAAHEFIALAERLGIVRHIDLRILDLAVHHLKTHPDVSLSVNVSMLTVCDSEWFSRLSAHFVATPGLANRLIIEITETVAIDDIERATLFVQSLRDLGCQVAIDDFGAGFSSYRNMRALCADMVKIDGDFVRDLKTNPEDRIFVRSLIELAQHAGFKTVAEWVQDEEAAALLREWGIDYLQGDHVGAPTMLLQTMPMAPDMAVA